MVPCGPGVGEYGSNVIALCYTEMEWEELGPCNVRHYWVVSEAWLGSRGRECPVKALLQLFSSTAFFRLLTDCTDLTLTAYYALQLQRWRAKDFTVSTLMSNGAVFSF